MLTSVIIPTCFNPDAVDRVLGLLEDNTDEELDLHVMDTTPVALGCVVSSNTGLANASGDVFVVMNDDCQPQKGWLPPLLAAVDLGAWLCSPRWPYARLGGHCLVFPRKTYELTGGFDSRYRHWCADHHLEMTLAEAGKPIRQVLGSWVIHDPGDPLRIHFRKSTKIGDHERLPNTGAWYNEDQAMFESIWGEKRPSDYWPEDWYA